jgi:hypothetical protein
VDLQVLVVVADEDQDRVAHAAIVRGGGSAGQRRVGAAALDGWCNETVTPRGPWVAALAARGGGSILAACATS